MAPHSTASKIAKGGYPTGGAAGDTSPLSIPPIPLEDFTEDWSSLGLTASSADYYFNSYNHYGVHEDMLKDAVTTQAYQKAILHNRHLFQDKVVLDVGCGLGILSLFAAQAGAKKVIGLESQAELVGMVRNIVKTNGYENIVTPVQGDALSLESLPDGVEQVDIIISEWMGYFLMYESRFADVIAARDKWLRPGGLILPDRALLHLELVEAAHYKEQHYDYFDNVWGFDFSPMRESAYSEPVVDSFGQNQMFSLISSSCCVLDLDIYTCTADDCFNMASQFAVTCKRPSKVQGVLVWFEIRFDSVHKPLSFQTGPHNTATCWKQVGFLMKGSGVPAKAGDRVTGMIAVRRPDPMKRDLEVKVQCKFKDMQARCQYYRWD
jgi:protein arginine N-methyltransferase 1